MQVFWLNIFRALKFFIHFTFQEYNNMAHQGLKRTLADVLDGLDDIKTSITDQQYNELCKKLKTAHDLVPTEATNEYKLTIWSFSAKKEFDAQFVVDDQGEYDQIELESHNLVIHQTHQRIQLRLQEFMEISSLLHPHDYIPLRSGLGDSQHPIHMSGRTRAHLEHLWNNFVWPEGAWCEQVTLDCDCDFQMSLFMPSARVVAIKEV